MIQVTKYIMFWEDSSWNFTHKLPMLKELWQAISPLVGSDDISMMKNFQKMGTSSKLQNVQIMIIGPASVHYVTKQKSWHSNGSALQR